MEIGIRSLKSSSNRLIYYKFSLLIDSVISLNTLLVANFCIISFFDLDLDCFEAKVTERTAEDMPGCMVKAEIVLFLLQSSYEEIATNNQQSCSHHYIFLIEIYFSSPSIIESE